MNDINYTLIQVFHKYCCWPNKALLNITQATLNLRRVLSSEPNHLVPVVPRLLQLLF